MYLCVQNVGKEREGEREREKRCYYSICEDDTFVRSTIIRAAAIQKHTKNTLFSLFSFFVYYFRVLTNNTNTRDSHDVLLFSTLLFLRRASRRLQRGFGSFQILLDALQLVFDGAFTLSLFHRFTGTVGEFRG